jgi:hypothetical protein
MDVAVVETQIGFVEGLKRSSDEANIKGAGPLQRINILPL